MLLKHTLKSFIRLPNIKINNYIKQKQLILKRKKRKKLKSFIRLSKNISIIKNYYYAMATET